MNKYELNFILAKISNSKKSLLLETYGSVENIYNNIERQKENNYLNYIWMELESSIYINIEELSEMIFKNEMKYCFYGESVYPYFLKNIEEPPFVLFYKGEIEKLQNHTNISIIGSRKCSNYGEEMAKQIIKGLNGYDINIISGGARGIDSIAHNISLKEGLYTTAVLGCGLDLIYPKENKTLYDEISKRGCIISEFMPGTPPYKINFPRRNRIISGLSELVIIVEAAERSGTLITANYALLQGKDVMAVPGSYYWKQSRGCNDLIKDGAYIFTGINDILELLGIDKKINNSNKSNKMNLNKNFLMKFIEDRPIHINEIINKSNIDIKVLYELLFEMQLAEEIICLAGDYYVKKI
ncbi:DNA-processing protein DprA [Clostridium algidicarnis]|uniref:DNA-processing protein DprA n=1 Tax=Clostridium algidicarnis TaxID=37659 RepID=UPI001626CF35|nr:DNA-processing protein DprA [Clostridium algidicarnis]MBB6631204.1 DNA-protecting protein DprA [Clostridium algidicarnis]MBU3205470.1 DNA-processing protein DprA [Clostridium algidicarnis]MCB2285625.1 DNA-processing protein DprA [Clostridium algidicarnis]